MQFGNTEPPIEACHPRFSPLREKNARCVARPIRAYARQVEGNISQCDNTLFILEAHLLTIADPRRYDKAGEGDYVTYDT